MLETSGDPGAVAELQGQKGLPGNQLIAPRIALIMEPRGARPPPATKSASAKGKVELLLLTCLKTCPRKTKGRCCQMGTVSAPLEATPQGGLQQLQEELMHRTVPSTKKVEKSYNQLIKNHQSQSYVISSYAYMYKYLITNKPKLETGCQIGLAINHGILVLICQCTFNIPHLPYNSFSYKCQVPLPLSFVRTVNLTFQTYTQDNIKFKVQVSKLACTGGLKKSPDIE